MGALADLKILYHLLLRPVRGRSHAARMESFYAGQATGYDAFRQRLLQGREELYRSIPIPEGGVWIDMGGGTGGNLEFLGDRLQGIGQVYLVDLSPSLLAVARRRVEERGWKNVEIVEGDATEFRPPSGKADVVTFSYSLTMIPDWFSAVENARDLLRPDGVLGAVDFYIARKYPPEGWTHHPWPTRAFWPLWFSGDNVSPSPDHVPFLHRHFQPVRLDERRARVPYLPFLRVPYYVFVGRKRRLPSGVAA